MQGQCLLILVLLMPLCSPTIKTLATSCFCDVSTDCDAYCCCDKECSAALIYNWNNYTQCASDGYSIPLCSSYYNEPMHKHDLYQGLRMIYTIVKRIFCISRVNFVDPAKGFSSSTTDSQISIPSSTVAATAFSGLTSISAYGNLPLRDSMGVCGSYVLRDMNSVAEGECRMLISSSSLSSNPFLNLSLFASNNNLSSLTTYLMTSPSAPAQSNTTSSTSCNSNNTCLVVKQLKLFFIKSSSGVSIDYSSSYVVLANTVITASTYVYIKYSYQFISQANNFPYSSNVGYSVNAPLTFLKAVTSSNTTNYYKVFNPVNLAFINLDGSCRSNSSDADHSNLISFKFGVNAVYSCLIGSATPLAFTYLNAAIGYVGSIGSASTSLADYVLIEYPDLNSVTNQNLALIFYYASIGTQANPQYKITKAKVSTLSTATNGQFNLFVQYISVSNSVVLNLPSPPVIDAYLPDDFLYPFYVA